MYVSCLFVKTYAQAMSRCVLMKAVKRSVPVIASNSYKASQISISLVYFYRLLRLLAEHIRVKVAKQVD